MQIKALRGAFGGYGSVRRGQIIDVPDHQAQMLVKRGIFVPVQGKEAAKTADARPSAQSQDGGPTGEAKPSSSSQEAPARKKRVSKKSKAAAE
jgi:hypothetical protein